MEGWPVFCQRALNRQDKIECLPRNDENKCCTPKQVTVSNVDGIERRIKKPVYLLVLVTRISPIISHAPASVREATLKPPRTDEWLLVGRSKPKD
jgi:hypothetical protein